MNSSKLGSSSALGFYSKHCKFLDGLWIGETSYLPEEQELDRHFGNPELTRTVEENRETLEKIYETVENDVARVDAAVKRQLLSKLQSFSAVTSKGRLNWGSHIWIQHLLRRKKLLGLQVGWNWESEEAGVVIRSWLWSKGGAVSGRAATAFLREQGVSDAIQEQQPGETRATVYFGRTSVVSHEGFLVDLDRLVAAVLSSFEWMNQERVESLLQAIREA